MTQDLVPEEFKVPEVLETSEFKLRKLCAKDVYLDYIAVISSINVITKTRGMGFTPDLTLEEDLIDLAWHQREFEHHTSFAYTVMNLDETECMGCVYFYPPGFRSNTNPPADTDCDISFWVTQKAYEKGLYEELYKVLLKWVEEWPFKKIYWSNIELPKI